jgi:hypothetical protein
MAFTLQAISRASAALGMDVTINYATGVGTPLGSVNIWAYNGGTFNALTAPAGDTQATISAANYFNAFTENFQLGDLIWVIDNALVGQFYVVDAIQYPTGLLPGITTITAFGAVIGVIGTANIANAAVTFAKIQNIGADSLVGNATAAPAVATNITLGNGLSFVGTVLQVTPAVGGYVRVAMTAAQWNGMYAAPVTLLAAQGANTLIVVDRVVEELTFVAAAYAAGGVVGLQYGVAAHLAGPAATATEAAADFFAAASTAFMQQGGLGTGAPLATSVNAALSISNATGAFTTGDGTWFIHVWYAVVATV